MAGAGEATPHPSERQRRARKIAMTPAEIDAFLAEQRTCTVATIGLSGPHVSALWFAWDGTSLWLTSLVRAQRWRNLERDPRVAVLVEDGDDYGELRGVELIGDAVPVGEIPRTGEPVEELLVAERTFSTKYDPDRGGKMGHDGRHAWLRLTPSKIVSWDFRKLPR